MLTFTKCYPEHVKLITPLPVQTPDHAALLTASGADMVRRSTGYTAWGPGSRCVGMAGICAYWKGRAEAWTLLGVEAQDFVIPILKFAKRTIAEYQETQGCWRLEMQVKAGNQHGARIAELCGLYLETRLWAAHPDSSDVLIYVRRG